jgi:Xaa-Pro aminopeptidase
MSDNLLLFSDSIRNADMYYVTHFLAPDAFVYLRKGRREILVVPKMEFWRAKKESRIKDVRSTDSYYLIDKRKKFGRDAMAQMIAEFLAEEGVKEVSVGMDFPLSAAEVLKKKKIVLRTENVIAKQRAVKSADEINAIKKAQRACEKAMLLAREMISRRKNITSEEVKKAVDHLLLDLGCDTEYAPIVACGKASADPHFEGLGPIRKNEPIILDFSPRLRKDRYYSDMTRTFVLGVPQRGVKEMYEVVLDAQNVAIDMIKEGVKCRDVHMAVQEIFDERGFGKKFLHSTGHGVGLELHEAPALGESEDVLEKGNVVTVEPGLYDKKVGGVRIEDIVVVRAKNCENITKFGKKLLL